MLCPRCSEPLLQEPMYDLPAKIKEYHCLRCGERFWLRSPDTKLEDLVSLDQRPPSSKKNR